MRPKAILILLLIIINTASQAQYILIAGDDPVQQKLAALPDSSLKKLVYKMYLVLKPTNPGEQAERLDITYKFNRVVIVPDSIHLDKYKTARCMIKLKGFLQDWFNNGNTTAFTTFHLDSNEINTVTWLKAQNLGTSTSTETSFELRTIKVGNEPERRQYVEVKKQVITSYYDTPDYSVIDCKITYAPSDADIYVIPRTEWIYKYKLTDPPLEQEITPQVRRQLSYLRINRGRNPFNIQLNEKTYIVMFDRNGAISFETIKPSTIYTSRNIINAKIK